MNYFIKETVNCPCGTSNTYYDTDTLNDTFSCSQCGQSIDNLNIIVNINDFAKKTLPQTVKPDFRNNSIWISTHEAALLFQEPNKTKSISSLQSNIRDLVKKGQIIGEKKGRQYQIKWPSAFDYLNKKQKEERLGLPVKEVATLLGISVAKLYKFLQNDNHPQYYGYKGSNNRWIVIER
jgi:hypothetical protein